VHPLPSRTWEFDEPRSPIKYRKPKGKKVDKLKVARLKDIEEKLAGADEAIAAHRAARRQITAPLIDRLLLTPKQIRQKAKGP
jgi:hypothetical protein